MAKGILIYISIIVVFQWSVFAQEVHSVFYDAESSNLFRNSYKVTSVLGDNPTTHSNPGSCVNTGDLPPAAGKGFTNPINSSVITTISTFPATANIRLICYFKNTSVYHESSGVVISGNHILVAAHAIYMYEKKYWPDSLEIITSLKDSETGEAVIWRTGKFKIHMMYKYFRGKEKKADIAVIEMEDSIGLQTGWLGYTYDQDYYHTDGSSFYHFSYPADDNDGKPVTQKLSYGTFTTVSTDWLGNDIIASPGESGSGFFSIKNRKYYLHGIRTYSDVGFNRFDEIDISWLNGVLDIQPERELPVMIANEEIKVESKTIFDNNFNQSDRVSSSAESPFYLFPNPASNYVTMKYPSGSSGAFLARVVDRSGRVVLTEKIVLTGSLLHHTIDVSQLSRGYYVVITTNNKVSYQQNLMVR